jgi:hypothetical protein
MAVGAGVAVDVWVAAGAGVGLLWGTAVAGIVGVTVGRAGIVAVAADVTTLSGAAVAQLLKSQSANAARVKWE